MMQQPEYIKILPMSRMMSEDDEEGEFWDLDEVIRYLKKELPRDFGYYYNVQLQIKPRNKRYMQGYLEKRLHPLPRIKKVIPTGSKMWFKFDYELVGFATYDHTCFNWPKPDGQENPRRSDPGFDATRYPFTFKFREKSINVLKEPISMNNWRSVLRKDHKDPNERAWVTLKVIEDRELMEMIPKGRIEGPF